MLFIVASALVGCATRGREFVRPEAGSLKLGETTQEQVIAKVGTPLARTTINKNGQVVEILRYAFSNFQVDKGCEPGVSPDSVQSFAFVDNKLVGQEYVSTVKGECTNFDDRKTSEIAKGTSTREDVRKLLGMPNGNYVFPMIPSRADVADVYLYSESRLIVDANNPRNIQGVQSSKLLVVSYDKAGVVTDVNLVTSTSGGAL